MTALYACRQHSLSPPQWPCGKGLGGEGPELKPMTSNSSDWKLIFRWLSCKTPCVRGMGVRVGVRGRTGWPGFYIVVREHVWSVLSISVWQNIILYILPKRQAPKESLSFSKTHAGRGTDRQTLSHSRRTHTERIPPNRYCCHHFTLTRRQVTKVTCVTGSHERAIRFGRVHQQIHRHHIALARAVHEEKCDTLSVRLTGRSTVIRRLANHLITGVAFVAGLDQVHPGRVVREVSGRRLAPRRRHWPAQAGILNLIMFGGQLWVS